MVHSGGFYVVDKRKMPDLASRTLHWFRWEAAMTWLSGFALLVLIYYLGGGALIDRDVYDISLGWAVVLAQALPPLVLLRTRSTALVKASVTRA